MRGNKLLCRKYQQVRDTKLWARRGYPCDMQCDIQLLKRKYKTKCWSVTNFRWQRWYLVTVWQYHNTMNWCVHICTRVHRQLAFTINNHPMRLSLSIECCVYNKLLVFISLKPLHLICLNLSSSNATTIRVWKPSCHCLFIFLFTRLWIYYLLSSASQEPWREVSFSFVIIFELHCMLARGLCQLQLHQCLYVNWNHL